MNIEVINLAFSYGAQEIISDLNLTLTSGSFTWLLGPNGGGKSTLLRLLTGELRPTRGTILLDGRAITDYSNLERAQKMGVMLQSAPPVLNFTVQEYIQMHLLARRSVWHQLNSKDQHTIAETLKIFDLTARSGQYCNQLSGGERQRVMLAAVWAAQTAGLFLDEPTSATDPAQSFALLKLLQGQAQKRTVFIISHDLNLAAQFADRLIWLKNGHILADGTPEQVLKPEILESVYDTPFTVQRTASGIWAIGPADKEGKTCAPPLF